MASLDFGFVLAMFLLVIAFRVKSETCEHGWFGPGCEYRCHCKNWWNCDANNGRCLNNLCAAGFAGAVCQYVDLAYNQATSGNFTRIVGSTQDAVDGDPGTCLESMREENATWTVQLTKSSWIHSVSVLVNTSANAEDLEVTIHNNDNDNDSDVVAVAQINKPSDLRYSYLPPRPVNGSRVQVRMLNSNASLSLCDVNVLGGRNVALKKKAEQGEFTYGHGTADKAVDGDTNPDYYDKSCSHTEESSVFGRKLDSWWTVHLGKKQHVWRVKVYNREGKDSNRLGWFRINVTKSDGSTEQVYRNTQRNPPPVVDVQLPDVTLATDVKLYHYERGKILTLCEVEIFGDCVAGYYGWLCDKECRCQDPREICDPMFGFCPVSGCRTGFRGDSCIECQNGTYGYKCNSNCSATCKDGSCHHVIGECTNGCKPGWLGQFCNETCPETNFGQNCSGTCPLGCETLCHHVTGECSQGCQPGWIGERCTDECQNRTYGYGCNSTCSATCTNGSCHHVTGECTNGCEPGWQGQFCNESCPQKTFGQNCSGTCPFECETLCHPVTGECSQGCMPGWKGENCTEKCSPGTHGVNCSEQCSVNCLNTSCDATSGACLAGCVEGMVGKLCDQQLSGGRNDEDDDECQNRTYGYGCNSTCSATCTNGSCYHVTGECTNGCEPGWQGQFCNEYDDTTVIVGVILALLLLILLGLLITVVVWMRRRPQSQHVKQESQATLLLSCEADAHAHQGASRTGTEGHEDEMRLTSDPAEDRSRRPSIEEGRKPQPAPRNLKKRQETYEQYELRQLSARKSKKAPSTIVEEEGSSQQAPEPEPEPEPETTAKRPQLMALFSRDASSSRPCSADVISASSRPSTAASSPQSKRATPTPSKKFASLASLDTLSVDDLEIVQMTSSVPRAADVSNDDLSKSDYYNVTCRDFSPNTVIMLKDLPARVAAMLADPRHFNRERSLLPPGNVAKCEVATLPQNIRKNRYRDVYPYDQSRVVLNPLPDDPYSDYYNACYIDGFNTEAEYIAAQGPMERTVHDFLRMVWDVNSERIIMLTNTVELGRFKCYQYWPDEGSLTIGDITVFLIDITSFADFCIRSLLFSRGDDTRNVTMFHYTAWPDNFAPASPWSLIHFRHKVHQMTSDGGPTIVHCSAGIGRTGTYLALDILLARAEREDKIDVFTCVWKLRQQRICMVQTLAQYIFIHETLAAALTTTFPVPVADFSLDRLLKGENGSRLLDREFENLKVCQSPPLEKEEKSSADSGVRQSAAHILSVPRDMDRVQVLSSDGKFSSVYINAIYLSSYKEARAFIQTHSPLEGGVVGFLSMILQHNVTSVVCLDTAHDFHEPGAVVYWPKTTTKVLKFGPYSVRLLHTTPRGWTSTWNIRITYSPPASTPEEGQGGEDGAPADKEYARDLTLFTCTQWPQSRSTPPSVPALLSLVSAVHPTEQEPVLVHCRDGHTRSGLFCVAATVIERMLEEDHVAVSYVTAHMRVPRRENIVNVEQYEFLYKCVQHAIDTVPDQGTTQSKTEGLQDSEENTLYCNIDTTRRNVTGEGENIDTLAAEDGDKGFDADDSEHQYGNIGSVRVNKDADTERMSADDTNVNDRHKKVEHSATATDSKGGKAGSARRKDNTRATDDTKFDSTNEHVPNKQISDAFGDDSKNVDHDTKRVNQDFENLKAGPSGASKVSNIETPRSADPTKNDDQVHNDAAVASTCNEEALHCDADRSRPTSNVYGNVGPIVEDFGAASPDAQGLPNTQTEENIYSNT